VQNEVNFLSNSNRKIDGEMKDDIMLHMRGLQTNSNEYFPSETGNYDLIHSSFNSVASDLCSKDMEHCIELM
jgi:hypothetical protein